MTDWSAWRACGICRTPLGEPCRALSGRIVAGQPDGVRTALEVPHRGRKRRTGR